MKNSPEKFPNRAKYSTPENVEDGLKGRELIHQCEQANEMMLTQLHETYQRKGGTLFGALVAAFRENPRAHEESFEDPYMPAMPHYTAAIQANFSNMTHEDFMNVAKWAAGCDAEKIRLPAMEEAKQVWEEHEFTKDRTIRNLEAISETDAQTFLYGMMVKDPGALGMLHQYTQRGELPLEIFMKLIKRVGPDAEMIVKDLPEVTMEEFLLIIDGVSITDPTQRYARAAYQALTDPVLMNLHKATRTLQHQKMAARHENNFLFNVLFKLIREECKEGENHVGNILRDVRRMLRSTAPIEFQKEMLAINQRLPLLKRKRELN